MEVANDGTESPSTLKLVSQLWQTFFKASSQGTADASFDDLTSIIPSLATATFQTSGSTEVFVEALGRGIFALYIEALIEAFGFREVDVTNNLKELLGRQSIISDAGAGRLEIQRLVELTRSKLRGCSNLSLRSLSPLLLGAIGSADGIETLTKICENDVSVPVRELALAQLRKMTVITTERDRDMNKDGLTKLLAFVSSRFALDHPISVREAMFELIFDIASRSSQADAKDELFCIAMEWLALEIDPSNLEQWLSVTQRRIQDIAPNSSLLVLQSISLRDMIPRHANEGLRTRATRVRGIFLDLLEREHEVVRSSAVECVANLIEHVYQSEHWVDEDERIQVAVSRFFAEVLLDNSVDVLLSTISRWTALAKVTRAPSLANQDIDVLILRACADTVPDSAALELFQFLESLVPRGVDQFLTMIQFLGDQRSRESAKAELALQCAENLLRRHPALGLIACPIPLDTNYSKVRWIDQVQAKEEGAFRRVWTGHQQNRGASITNGAIDWSLPE